MFESTHPRINRPDKAGIIRRLFASSTDAKASLAAVNVRNDSVVFVRIRCVVCKWWLPSEDVGSIPSKENQYCFYINIKVHLHLERTPITHHIAVTIEIPYEERSFVVIQTFEFKTHFTSRPVQRRASKERKQNEIHFKH